MPQYRVELASIDPNDKSKDIYYSQLVVANNSDEAINKAKLLQMEKKPELLSSRVWAWSAYETAERES